MPQASEGQGTCHERWGRDGCGTGADLLLTTKPRLVIDSATMPDWLDWLEIENLRVGESAVSLNVWEKRKYCRLLKPVRDRDGRIRFREIPRILQEVI
jgi:hypothetical protein